MLSGLGHVPRAAYSSVVAFVMWVPMAVGWTGLPTTRTGQLQPPRH